MSTSRLNGRHITGIVTAVCVAIVLAPVTVLATTSSASKVYITDPSNAAHRAHVSATGALSIGGTVIVGNLPATQPVSGSVTANPGLPGTPFTSEAGGSTPTVNVPAGKHVVAQTISITVAVTSGAGAFADLEYVSGGSTGDLFIPLTYAQTASGYDYYSATAVVDVYADPSTSIILDASSPTGSFLEKVLTVSGYEV